MKSKAIIVVSLAVTAGVTVTAAYFLDRKEDRRNSAVTPAPNIAIKPDVSRQAVLSTPPAASPATETAAPPRVFAQPGKPIPAAKLPPSHPPLVTAPPEAHAREGRLQSVPERPYTHYRVGNNSVTAIYADGAVIWVGTSGGLVRYDTTTQEFKKYDANDGLRANGILCLGKVQGRISVGTYGGGLSLYDERGGKWEHYGTAEGLGDAFVYDVLETSRGDVWIATGSGASRIRGGFLKDGAKWDLYNVSTTAGGLPHDRIYRIAEGRDGSIWLATRGGAANFQNGNWRSWTQASGMGARETEGRTGSDALREALQRRNGPQEKHGAGAKPVHNPDHIAALEVAKDGVIWVGTRGAGVARFDGEKWTSHTASAGLPSNYVSALHFDRHGRLWVATTNGLAVYRDGKFQVLTTANGLLNENVLAVTTAMDDDVWVGSFGGVARIQKPLADTVAQRGK